MSDDTACWLDLGEQEMKQRIQKVVFFVVSLALLFLIYRCGMMMKESKSPYVRFPDKIDTFK